jgi:hypothetical protein
MNRSIFTVGAVIAVAGLVAIPEPVAAQFGGLRGAIPGASPSRAASVDPDAFLAETIETTHLMMVAAVVLAKAGQTGTTRASLQAEITDIQSKRNIGELNTLQASFRTNVEAASRNFEDAAANQASYDAMTAEQQQLMLSAGFNFVLAMVRNVRLAQQVPQLVQSMQSNPMLLTKLGSIRSAGGLLAQQAQLATGMLVPLRSLMARGGVEVPTDAQTTTARVISLP